jgi:hypothetical protein
MDTQGCDSSGPSEAMDAGAAGSDHHWELVRDRLAELWPTLTLSELDATHGRPAMVAAILESKIAYAQRLAGEALGQPQRASSEVRRRWAGVRSLAPAASVLGLLLVSPFL